MPNGIEVEGLEKLLSQLQKLPVRVYEGSYAALDSTLDLMANDTADIAIMKGVYDTGELVDSIRTSLEGSSEDLTGQVIVDVEHAVYNELGWGASGAVTVSGIDPDIKPVYTMNLTGFPARPFVTPAYFLNKDNSLKIFKKEINRSIKTGLY